MNSKWRGVYVCLTLRVRGDDDGSIVEINAVRVKDQGLVLQEAEVNGIAFC